MYCTKCHYGSDTCILPTTGAEVTNPDNETVPEVRCPRCGHRGAPLLKGPFATRQSSTAKKEHKHKRTNEQDEIVRAQQEFKEQPLPADEAAKELHEEAIRATSGQMKVMDYSRLK